MPCHFFKQACYYDNRAFDNKELFIHNRSSQKQSNEIKMQKNIFNK